MKNMEKMQLQGISKGCEFTQDFKDFATLKKHLKKYYKIDLIYNENESDYINCFKNNLNVLSNTWLRIYIK